MIESVQTFSGKCSLCLRHSYQMAGSYHLKNTSAYALWNCIDTWASGLMVLEGIHPRIVRVFGGDHERRLGGWFSVYWYSWEVTPSLSCLSSFLCLSWSRRFTSEDSFILLHWESFLIISTAQASLSCYNRIPLRTVCSSVVRKCCCWVYHFAQNPREKRKLIKLETED